MTHTSAATLQFAVGSSVQENAAKHKASPALVRSFDEVTRADVKTVGGKGANLGELVHAGSHESW